VSHTWRTGQDQSALIKRLLAQYLPPSTRIFLDTGLRIVPSLYGPTNHLPPPPQYLAPPHTPATDDLDDIERIPEHIDASVMVLFFLSKGYFLSRAVLVEIDAGAPTL
jgi:hypothetical protein